MNRSFSVFAGMASIALALVLSTQISSSAQISTSAKISAPAKIRAPAKISTAAKFSAPAKISTPAKNFSALAKISTAADQKQPHRLAVQDDVNDPAVMNLALHNVSNVVQRYH